MYGRIDEDLPVSTIIFVLKVFLILIVICLLSNLFKEGCCTCAYSNNTNLLHSAE